MSTTQITVAAARRRAVRTGKYVSDSEAAELRAWHIRQLDEWRTFADLNTTFVPPAGDDSVP
jgi:hypothetical protein